MTFDVAWYQAVMDTVPEAVIVCGATGVPVLANQRALDLLGLTIEQVRQEAPVDEAWHVLRTDGSVRPFDDLPIERALRSGRSVHHDVHGIHRADGSVVWVTANVQLVAEPTPDLAAVATFRDTTELHIGRNVDQALLRTAARLVERAVGDSSMMGDHLDDVAALCAADRVLFVALEHDSGRARVTHEWARSPAPTARTSEGVRARPRATDARAPRPTRGGGPGPGGRGRARRDPPAAGRVGSRGRAGRPGHGR